MLLGAKGTAEKITRPRLLLSSVTIGSWIHDPSIANPTLYHWATTPPLDSPSPSLDNIRVMVIVWRLRGNIIRTALCWIVWHNVHTPQHTYVSSSYRSNRLGLSQWDPCAVHRGGCLKLYYCNMVEWFWSDSSLIFDDQLVSFSALTLLLWSSACKNRPPNDLLCVEWDVKPYTLIHLFLEHRIVSKQSSIIKYHNVSTPRPRRAGSAAVVAAVMNSIRLWRW